MSDPTGPIDLQPDPPRKASSPPVTTSPSAEPLPWPEVGVCAATAGGLLWVAHFALTWDRLLVGAVMLGIGFGLGHWIATRKAEAKTDTRLLRGVWAQRARMAGAVLGAAAAIELLWFSLTLFGHANDRYFTVERLPVRPLVAGTGAMLLGAWIVAAGWRADPAVRVDPISRDTP